MTTSYIEKVTGEFERSGACEGCGKAVARAKSISAPSYEQMIAAGEEWGRGPLLHPRCERPGERASKWRSRSGKVHYRRRRFWVGTSHETEADPSIVITLCGSRQQLTPAPDDATVDCGVCIKSANTRAHLP